LIKRKAENARLASTTTGEIPLRALFALEGGFSCARSWRLQLEIKKINKLNNSKSKRN